MIANCAYCGTEINRKPAALLSGKVYCNRQCQGKATRKNTKICSICGTEFVGHKINCSRACANKARSGIKYTGEQNYNRHSNRNRLKIKLAELNNGVCDNCGNSNYAILQVHHIKARADNGTNDLDNLVLLCPNCHMTQHHGNYTYEDWKRNPIGNGNALEKQ